MPLQTVGYQVRPFGRDRQLVADAGWLARRKHMMHGLVEVDVTAPRRLIREEKGRTGEGLSFTAFALACIGAAVEVDRSVQAYRDWRNQLIIFDDVDVLITVEIEHGGTHFPLVHMVHAVNRRSARAIHEEIRAVQRNPAGSPGARFIDLFPRLPQFVRRGAYRLLDKRPDLRKQYMGTVGFTSLGMMFGGHSGWAIGAPSHSLAIAFGGIAPKPMMVEQQVVMREALSVTISFDHDIIDGAPAARFAQQFVTLVENAHGLAT
jgi:pyruvate/2-oxoglutarate dehydrogenase complex dihydrolipoamide acyltransferase (E2) component